MTQHLPRTVVVNVLTTRTLEIEEPAWCKGHAEDHAEFKTDLTHYGPEHVIEAGGIEVLRAMLAQSPYSEHSSPDLVLYVEESSLTGSYTPAEVEELAAALEASAGQLRALGRQLTEILAGGGQ